MILGALTCAGPLVGGCVRAKAKAVAEAPPLETPPAPPRVVEAAEATPAAPIGLIEEPAREPVRPAPRPAPPRAATNPPRPDPGEQKADASKNDPPPELPKVAEDPRPSPPTLQTAPLGSEVEVERKIRTVITKAAADLNRVNYRALNSDARTQYNTAKRFIEQAEDALRKRNLIFAGNLADKALGLAAQLAGR